MFFLYHFAHDGSIFQPEAAPARVTLGVTSILTLSTQHAKSQAALPPVSYLKAIDLFMSACTMYENAIHFLFFLRKAS